MLRLIREIRDAGEVHVILSSHLLRDVEECCDEVLVLKDGQIAAYCNLEEERRANRKFLELETARRRRRRFAAAPSAARAASARLAPASGSASSWCCPTASRSATSTGSRPSARCRSAGSTTSATRSRTSS